MKFRWLLVLFLGASITTSALANFAIFQTVRVNDAPTWAVSCDITTGVATGTGSGTCIASPAACTGASDDSAAFVDFQDWAVNTWQASHSGQIRLFIPAGSECSIQGTIVSCVYIASNGCPFSGISNLLVQGGDSTSRFFVGDSISLGGIGQIQNESNSVRLQTATVGSSCVTATRMPDGTTPPDVSMFVVGRYALITGFDLQGLYGSPFGFPTNPFWYEYLKIASVNTGTYEVCFETTLQNEYKDTWPEWNHGNAFEVDNGGPATLYALGANWDATIEFSSLQMERASAAQIYTNARSVTYRDVVFTGGSCAIPSQNLTFTYYGVDLTTCTTIEVDKLIETINIVNSSFDNLQYQSSVNVTNMSGSTVSNLMLGTGRVFNGSNNTFNQLRTGATAHGRADSFSCTGCSIASYQLGAALEDVDKEWSIASNVITIPNTCCAGQQNQTRTLTPGAYVGWGGGGAPVGFFRVDDVTQDATNVYVSITPTSSSPPWGTSVFPSTTIFSHPAPIFTCSGCTGGYGAVAALFPAGEPLYSYIQLTFTGANGTTPVFGLTAWGLVSEISINVTNASTTGGALSFKLSQFDNWQFLVSSLTTSNYAATVNAKTAGNRVITLSGETGTQTGDSGLAVPDATVSWLEGGSNSGAIFSSDVSADCPGAGCPSVTVTITTDQGIPMPYLLNRDLDPASNDNTPAFLNQAA